MSTWAVSFIDTFLNELLNLPQSVSKRVSKVVKLLEPNPISAGEDAKKLKGYANNTYRVRIGDYRLFYSFGQGWVKLLSIHRQDERTYELELPEFVAPTPPPEASVLNPQLVPTASLQLSVESKNRCSHSRHRSYYCLTYRVYRIAVKAVADSPRILG